MSLLLRLLLLLAAIAALLVLVLGSGLFSDRALHDAEQLVMQRHEQQVLLLRGQAASQQALTAVHAYLDGDAAARATMASRRTELDYLAATYQDLVPGDSAAAEHARLVGAFNAAAGGLLAATEPGNPNALHSPAGATLAAATAALAAAQDRMLNTATAETTAAQQAADAARSQAIQERTYATAISLALLLLLSVINFVRHGQPLITLARQARRALRLPPQEMPAFVLDRTDPGTAQELARALNTLVARLREQYIDLERANAGLHELNEEARAASQAKTAFVASISHELRTPLNAILGFSEMLLSEMYGPITAQQRTQLERIQRNGQNLLTLINDVLDISRVEAGKVSLSLEQVDAGQVATAVAGTMEPLARQKGLAWHLEIAPDLPPLTTDENRLRQVLLNLLSNAVKFTHQGSVALWVGSEASLPNWLLFRVSDTGIGIPAGELDRIWEEFYQVSHGLSRTAGGSGLGLAIVHKLVELLGGDIAVHSVEGEGSVFTIYLPLAPSAVRDGAAGASQYAASGVFAVSS